MSVVLHSCDMHSAKNIILWKVCRERAKNINNTCFKKQCGHMIPQNVYFFTSNTMCIQLKRATTRTTGL